MNWKRLMILLMKEKRVYKNIGFLLIFSSILKTGTYKLRYKYE